MPEISLEIVGPAPEDTPLEDSKISLFSDTGEHVYTAMYLGAPLSVDLAEGTYTLVLTKAGTTFKQNAIEILVEAITVIVSVVVEWVEDLVVPTLDESLVTCFVKIVSLAGQPRADVDVLISTQTQKTIEDGSSIIGDRIALKTDSEGYAETILPKGSEIVLGLSGTPIYRQIKIPEVGDDPVNLLEIEALVPDFIAPVRSDIKINFS